jgi:hypothetical protein
MYNIEERQLGEESHMGAKIRKEIYIEPEKEAILKLMADNAGLSESDIIQQALDRQAEALGISTPNVAAWEQERTFIEEFVQRQPATTPWKWNREELYDRKVLRGH